MVITGKEASSIVVIIALAYSNIMDSYIIIATDLEIIATWELIINWDIIA